MIFAAFVLYISFSFSYKGSRTSIKEIPSQECLPLPDDGDFTEIKTGGTYSDNHIYACNKIFQDSLLVQSHLLRIYNCNLVITVLEFLKNAIELQIENLQDERTIEIVNCRFVKLDYGTIKIASGDSSRFFNITGCSFWLSKASSKGLASSIEFKGNNCIIQKCEFINCDSTKSCIHYQSVSGDSTNKLKIDSCLFEKKIEINGITTKYLIKFTDGSKFDFTNNEIIIQGASNSPKIFDWPAGLESTGFNVQGNIVYPNDESLYDNVKDVFPEGFKIRPIMDCPNPPEENIDSKNFMCEGSFGEISSMTNSGPVFYSNSIVGIYYTTFSYIKNVNSKKGGAIYIDTKDVSASVTAPVKIHHCDFFSCQAVEGLSIYIETSDTSRLYDISECYFCNTASFTGFDGELISGCIYIKSSGAHFKITKSYFKDYDIEIGGSICYYSEPKASQSKLLESNDENAYALYITECTFRDNDVKTNGGAIFLSLTNGELSQPILISCCEFMDNNAVHKDSSSMEEYDEPEYGGAIYYKYDSTSYLEQTNQEISYIFRVIDCTFKDCDASYSGGGVYVLISNFEPSRPIEIINCLFLNNGGNIEPESNLHAYGYGGGICYDYCPKTPATNAPRSTPSFYVYDCTFEKNKCLQSGGSIMISIQNGEPLGPIEISECSFNNGKAYSIDINDFINDGKGGEIYYVFNSSTISSTDPNTIQALNINKCNFSNSQARYFGGSLYLLIESGQPSRPVEINSCNFDKCQDNENKDNIYILSHSSSTPILVNDCEFIQNGIFVDSQIATIQSCRFKDVLYALKYKCTIDAYNGDLSVLMKDCNFSQETQIDSLIYFETKLASKFIFTGNNVSIPNANAYALGCVASLEIVEDRWSFEGNYIYPDDGKNIKTTNAEKIPAECFKGFFCYVKCHDGTSRCDINGDEEEDTTINITGYTYDTLTGDYDGAAIHLLNYALTCLHSTFTGCVSNKGGGGGIYIKLDKKLKETDNIYLYDLHFTSCQAVYGGALYIYSNSYENDIRIISCEFVSNIASATQVEGVDKFGGSACFLETMNSILVRNKYSKNNANDVKLYNNWESSSPLYLLSSDKPSIEFSECSFETTTKSASSIYYVRGNKNDVQINVNDCTFEGKLSKGSYNIDGISLDHENEIPKFNIKSCKFANGIKSALNMKNSKPKFLEELSSNNSFEKESSNNNNNSNLLSVIAITAGICAILIIVITVVIKKRNNEQTENEEEEQNEL